MLSSYKLDIQALLKASVVDVSMTVKTTMVE